MKAVGSTVTLSIEDVDIEVSCFNSLYHVSMANVAERSCASFSNSCFFVSVMFFASWSNQIVLVMVALMFLELVLLRVLTHVVSRVPLAHF